MPTAKTITLVHDGTEIGYCHPGHARKLTKNGQAAWVEGHLTTVTLSSHGLILRQPRFELITIDKGVCHAVLHLDLQLFPEAPPEAQPYVSSPWRPTEGIEVLISEKQQLTRFQVPPDAFQILAPDTDLHVHLTTKRIKDLYVIVHESRNVVPVVNDAGEVLELKVEPGTDVCFTPWVCLHTNDAKYLGLTTPVTEPQTNYRATMFVSPPWWARAHQDVGIPSDIAHEA